MHQIERSKARLGPALFAPKQNPCTANRVLCSSHICSYKEKHIRGCSKCDSPSPSRASTHRSTDQSHARKSLIGSIIRGEVSFCLCYAYHAFLFPPGRLQTMQVEVLKLLSLRARMALHEQWCTFHANRPPITSGPGAVACNPTMVPRTVDLALINIKMSDTGRPFFVLDSR